MTWTLFFGVKVLKYNLIEVLPNFNSILFYLKFIFANPLLSEAIFRKFDLNLILPSMKNIKSELPSYKHSQKVFMLWKNACAILRANEVEIFYRFWACNNNEIKKRKCYWAFEKMALYENFIAAIFRRWKISCEFICAMFTFVLVYLKCLIKILLLAFLVCCEVAQDKIFNAVNSELKLLTFSNINFVLLPHIWHSARNCSFSLHEIRLCLLFGNWNSYFALNFKDKYLTSNANRSESILNINFQATTLRHLWPHFRNISVVSDFMQTKKMKKISLSDEQTNTINELAFVWRQFLAAACHLKKRSERWRVCKREITAFQAQ